MVPGRSVSGIAMMPHSPASGVSEATLILHRLKEEVNPAIHHPHLFVGTDTELPRLDPECPHSQEVKLGTAKGLGQLLLLLGPLEGGVRCCGSPEAILQQLPAGLCSHRQCSTSGC